MHFARTTIAALLMSLAVSAASAATLSATQVGNVSTEGVPQFSNLTVNWIDGWKNVGFIQFDLSGYSAGVSNAVLNLYHQHNSVLGATFALYVNTSPWSSPVNTWNDRPSYTTASSSMLTIEDTSQGLWRSVDVTAAANAWATGAMPNYGFTLERTDQVNPNAYFVASGEFAPTLNVTAVPEPEAYAMLLAGLGVMGAVARRRKQKALA